MSSRSFKMFLLLSRLGSFGVKIAVFVGCGEHCNYFLTMVYQYRRSYRNKAQKRSYFAFAFTAGLLVFFLVDAAGGGVLGLFYFLGTSLSLLFLQLIIVVADYYMREKTKSQKELEDLRYNMNELKDTVLHLNEALKQMNKNIAKEPNTPPGNFQLR